MPLVWVAKLAPWLSIRATAMLFNALVTTATALLLYTFVRDLGYRTVTALALGLIYGVATFAVTYVKTLFGEPLAALLVLLIVFLTTQIDKTPCRGQRCLAAIGLLLGLLVGVNTVYAVFVPLIAVFVFAGHRVAWREAVAFALPLSVVMGGLALYNAARFGSPFTSGYHFAAGEGFSNPLLLGVFGLTLSPYRGVFWYNPVLLLCIPGWLIFRRAHAKLAWLALALIVLQVLAFATWWSWHGGITWGARFLLPALPLMVLFLAPLVESGKRWTRAAVGGLAVLSFGIQILGILYNYLLYEAYMMRTFWPDLDTAVETLRQSSVLIDPLYSPILGHFALLRADAPVEMAWAANGVDTIHLLAALGLIAVGVVSSFLRRGVWLAVFLAIIVSLNIVVARQTPAHVRELENALQPPGVVLAATTLYESGLVDVENGARVISVNAPTSPEDARARHLAAYAQAQARDMPFWYVTWFGAGDLDDWQARVLWESAYFVVERPLLFSNHRALWFDLTPPIEPEHVGGWRFADRLVLDRYGIAADDDGVHVVIAWTSTGTVSDNYAWFVHVIDANGQIVSQQDRPPQGGYTPTSVWQPDSPVIDRLFFPLPPNTDASGWQVRVGWVSPENGALLPVLDRQGQPVPDNFVLLPITP
jgi:hypothetical protein